MPKKYERRILDVPTRWNSTYEMLKLALKLEPALNYLWDESHLNELKLSKEEWINIELIAKFLKSFKHVSTIIAAEKKVTLPIVTIAFNMLVDKVEAFAKELDDKIERDKYDEILINAIMVGRDKLLKHYKKCNWVYCVALILDPRFKLDGFDTTDWGKS